MPRIYRGIFPHCPFHVLNRGNARQKIFHNDSDYQSFMQLISKAKKRHPVKIYAFCLMPNHFHICMSTDQASNISQMMQWLLTSHVRRAHSLNKTSGHLWQGRFKSFSIQCDTHLLTVLRYIEANPVRAKLVASARQWPWSSFAFRENPRGLGILDPSPVPLPEHWEDYVNSSLPIKELEAIRHSVGRQSPLGEIHWVEEIARRFGLWSTLNPRGRPRKSSKK